MQASRSKQHSRDTDTAAMKYSLRPVARTSTESSGWTPRTCGSCSAVLLLARMDELLESARKIEVLVSSMISAAGCKSALLENNAGRGAGNAGLGECCSGDLGADALGRAGSGECVTSVATSVRHACYASYEAS